MDPIYDYVAAIIFWMIFVLFLSWWGSGGGGVLFIIFVSHDHTDVRKLLCISDDSLSVL